MKGLKNWEIFWPDYQKGMDQKTTATVQKKRERGIFHTNREYERHYI